MSGNSGKKILITGGTSGIGFSTAKLFLEQGACVLITGRSQINIDNALQKLDSQSAMGMLWDAEQDENIGEMIEKACDMLGEIDVAVCNAGVTSGSDFSKKIEEIKEEDLDYCFKINMHYNLKVCNRMIEYFAENLKKGKIIITTSNTEDLPAYCPYQLSKWALKNYIMRIANEAEMRNVVVCGVAPGPTKTKMTCSDDRDIYTTSSPNGRIAYPEEIAECIAFMANCKTNLYNGKIVTCDGGQKLL